MADSKNTAWVEIVGNPNKFIETSLVWYGGTAIITGGTNIHKITITTLGNSTSFGSVPVSQAFPVSCSSGTDGFFSGSTVIYKINFSTGGAAVSFSTLSASVNEKSSGSNSIMGVFGSTSILLYIIFSTKNSAADFVGKLLYCVTDTGGYMSNGTRCVFGCYNNYIEYITFSNKSNAILFGNASVSRIYTSSTSNSVRGVIGGGNLVGNTIDYITISTESNATDFGDLTSSRRCSYAASNNTRGIFGSSSTTVIDYITISTLGNATNFGYLSVDTFSYPTSCSGD